MATLTVVFAQMHEEVFVHFGFAIIDDRHEDRSTRFRRRKGLGSPAQVGEVLVGDRRTVSTPPHDRGGPGSATRTPNRQRHRASTLGNGDGRARENESRSWSSVRLRRSDIQGYERRSRFRGLICARRGCRLCCLRRGQHDWRCDSGGGRRLTGGEPRLGIKVRLRSARLRGCFHSSRWPVPSGKRRRQRDLGSCRNFVHRTA